MSEISRLQEREDAQRVSRSSIKSLERFVMLYIQKLDSSPNWREEDVFHCSEIAKACERFEVFKRRLPKAPDPMQEIDPDRFGYFSIGKAIHRWWQNEVLGKARVLRGSWKCSRCFKIVRGFMPDTPCPDCKWPLRPREWAKLAKKTTKPLLPMFDPQLACKTVCRWPGGYENGKLRDCANCELGGAWGFVEPVVEYPELELFGHSDGILVLDAEDWILELKSCSQFEFAKLESPYPEHIVQANAYMKVLKVPRALIPYVNKGNGRLKVFEIFPDPKLWDELEDIIFSIRKGVRTGRLPQGCCKTAKETRAKACPYREECFSGYDTIEDIQDSLERQAAARQKMAERKARLAARPNRDT